MNHQHTQNEEKSLTTSDVIIVGGGIAGLYSALKYLTIFPKASVVLLEASSKLGGRLQTYYSSSNSSNKYKYEIGGSRFNQNHKLLISLIKKYNCNMIPIGSKKQICTFNKSILHAPTWKLPNTFKPAPKAVLINLTFGKYLETYYSKEERLYFQTQFGYDGEFDIMNASDAIRIFERDFSEKSQYYIIQEGFTTLVNRIRDDLLQRGCKIYTKSSVTNFKYDTSNSTFKVNTNTNKHFISSKLFMALPQSALKKFEQWKEANWLNSVTEIPLLRVYGKFTKASSYLDKRITTDLSLRQYIPTDPINHISMVSYCDTKNAIESYKKYKKDPVQWEKELMNQVFMLQKKCLSNESTQSNIIPEMVWIRPYYWEHGVHVWNVKTDSAKMHLQARSPMGSRVPCYIVGEAYSVHQGWVEGALETVEEVFEKYL